MVSALSGGAPLRGLAAAALGIMIAMVGTDPTTGTLRWTMGMLYLWDGIHLVPVVLGIFALPELADMAIERRSIAGNAKIDARTGQLAWEVDRGQGADREQPVGRDAEDQDAHHDEDRHDGAPDEDLGNVHRAFAPSGWIFTLAPLDSRSAPRTTTLSPGSSPLATTDRSPSPRATVTGRTSTPISGPTT